MKKGWLIFGIASAFVVGGVLAYFSAKKVKEIILSAEQEKFVRELHPKVQNDFRRFIKEVQDKYGYDVIITDAYRTFAESAKFKKLDPRNATPGYSAHNYGIAIDMVLQKDGKMLHKNDAKSAWEATGIPQLAKTKYGMRWGGDFTGYTDNVHFDFANKYPTDHLRQLAIQQFGSDENKIQGNKVVIS